MSQLNVILPNKEVIFTRDEGNNTYFLRYISNDDFDKCAICILELAHPSNYLPGIGLKLWINDINYCTNWNYEIIDIYTIIGISIICKVKFIGSDNGLEQQLFANLNISNHVPTWNILKNLQIDTIYDYDMCKLMLNNIEFIYVILKKDVFNNSYIIRLPSEDELNTFLNKEIFSVINIIETDFLLSELGNNIYNKWLTFMNLPNILYNKNDESQEIVHDNKSELLNESQEIVDDNKLELLTESQEIVDDNKSELLNESQEIVDDNKLELLDESQEIVDNNKSELLNESFKNLDDKYEEDNTSNEDNSSCKDILENIENNISEKDSFYENTIYINPNDMVYVINDKIIRNSDLPTHKLKDEKKNVFKNNKMIKYPKKKKNNKQISKEDNKKYDDIIVELYSKFDNFYDLHILETLLEKSVAFKFYTDVILLFDKETLDNDILFIFDKIYEKFYEKYPKFIIKDKNQLYILYDSDDSNINLINDIRVKSKELLSLSNKEDDLVLIKSIKPFKAIFGDVFSDISPSKKKLLLIYFTISDPDDFLNIIPSILFQNDDNELTDTGIIKEEKVTIFHMCNLFAMFRAFVHDRLSYINADFDKVKVDDQLLKLLYQYFSVFIVHNKLNKLMIVKNNIYSHYIKIIQYHIRFLFPNFVLGGELPNERIDTVVSFEDRFILKCRIIVSYLLKDLEPTKYYIATGYMSSFLNLGLYVYDLDKTNDFLNDSESLYVLNFEVQIKKELEDCISRIVKES